MKPVAILLSMAAFAWGSAVASAQCPSCGSSGGAAGGAPGPGVPGGIGKEPAKKATFDVILRYYAKASEARPAALKTALEKVKGVQSVVVAESSNTAVVTFAGKCEQIGALETAAQNAGFPALVLNHAHVLVSLKPLKGADPKAATAELALVFGVHGVNASPSGLELHADLEKLSLADLREAAAKFKCEVIVNLTFEYVSYKILEGTLPEFEAAAASLKGVMVVRDEGDRQVGLWINKAMVKAEQLEKLDGFKLERQ